MINSALQQYSASSNPLATSKSDRKLLLLCAFWLTLLLGSSLQLVLSYLPDYDRQAYQRAFIGRKFFSEGVARQVRNEDFLHEVRHTEPKTVLGAAHADVYREEVLYCDRTHYRTDVCVATGGDVRVLGGRPHGGSYQVLVSAGQSGEEKIEIVKPYTRKWETSVMKSIDEVMVIKKVLFNRSNGRALASLSQNSFAQVDTKALRRAPHNQSAKLHGIDIKLQHQEQDHSSVQRYKRQSMKGCSGSTSKELPQKPKTRRQSEVQGSHDHMHVQREKMPAGTRAALQRAVKPSSYAFPECEVRHEVPAILFSTGGYTGNVYHEFNDGLIPLYITAQQYAPGQVVLIVLEYHHWWMSKYAEVVAQISNYTVIDLAHDKRVHCFPEVTVGLRIHGELAIHTENSHQPSIRGFQSMLRAAYAPSKREKAAADGPGSASKRRRPRLVLLSRSSPRALLNEEEVIAMAREIGFSVQVLAPTPKTRMVDVYKEVSRCEVMVGVHGAAMTHLLFMRPGATFVQVVPLGTEWAAATYYGEPAQKLGLKYVEYKVSARESSLWEKYRRDDPVLVNPESVNKKGWWETKRIYLEAQDVTVSLDRMRVTLLSAYGNASLTLSSSSRSR